MPAESPGEAFRVGVQLPEVERPIGWPEMRDIARTIEDVGFDSLWVGDHLLYRDGDEAARGPMEAWSILAALAEVTERVSLGPLVASAGFHSPAMLAKNAATVDEISGGRLIFGLGAGSNRVDYDAFGFSYDHRVARFSEAFTIVRRLLAGETFDFDGEYYELRGAELNPPARPDLPLMVGSNGPKMLRLTTPYVAMWNSWFLWFGNRASGLGPLMAAVDEACLEVGRDPAEVERTAAVLVQLEGGTGRNAGDSERPTAPPLRGSADELAASLFEFAEAGISHLQLVLDPITSRSVEQMGEVLRLIR